MPTNILSVGSSPTNSSDVTVDEGEQLTVCLKDAAGVFVVNNAWVYIDLKDDAGQYYQVDELHKGKPAVVITAAGTYRFRRVRGACGVFSG